MRRRRSHSRIVLLLLTLVIGGLLTWKTAFPASAQIIPFPTFTTITFDIPRQSESIITKAYNAVKAKIKIATDIAFKNGAQTFLATAVQQFATQLATAAPGQKPLFLTKPSTFFKDVENAAAGQFIDDFTRGLTGASFDQRGQLVGGTTGPGAAGSSERNRFIISRLLRTASDATGDQCQFNCGVDNSITAYTTIPTDPKSYTNFADVPGKNDHDRAVYILNGQLLFDIGVKKTSTDPIVCRNISPQGEAWGFNFGTGSGGSIPPFSTMTFRECYNNLLQVINAEKHDVGEDAKQCLRQCKNGIGGATRSAITRATATDIFSAVENFDIRQSPTAIANRLSRDESDFGQFIQASALLTATVQTKVLGEQTKLNAGTLPRTSKVSEEVLTPKEATSALFGVPFYNNDGQLTYTGTGAADILKGLASFINSPVGKALVTYFKSRCGLNPDVCKGASDPQSEVGRFLFGASSQSGLAAARVQLATLGQVDIISGQPGRDQVDIISQLTSSGLIDSRFGQAVDEKLTVKEAVERNLIDGERTFGFDNNGIEPKDGYPFRSLQYLRKYRVIPVGWELAAKYSKEFSSQNLTLNFLLGQFPMCGQTDQAKVCSVSLKSCTNTTDCQTGDQNGGTCGASPYCGLVDPDWVLKAPQTYCRRQGAGEDILTKEFVCDQNNINKDTGEIFKTNGDRGTDDGAPNCVYDPSTNLHPDVGHWVISRDTNTCADTQSCIAEKSDGTCLAYGYCLQEKETFKFSGTQCDAQNATCTSYTNSQGQTVAYLANTVDATTCTPGSAGCQWYCQKPSFDETKKVWTCTESVGSKIYFTSKAQECNVGDAGCTQFIKIGPGANLLANSGFDLYEGGEVNGAPAPALFTGWDSGPISMTPVAASDALNNTGNTVAVGIVAPGVSDTITQTVDIGGSLEERIFTASVRVKSESACKAQMQLCLGTNCDSSPLAPSAIASVGTDWGTAAVQITIPTKAELNTSETRLTVRIQPGVSNLDPNSGEIDCTGAGLTIDSAQLEEVAGITPYKEYGTSSVLSLNGKRLSCTKADVGCEAYTAVSGGAKVNAIVTPSNRCSADSVGCQIYQRQPITTLPYRDYNPVTQAAITADATIVASKGKQCTAASVGCEEYTNLDAVAKGGEGKEYFSAVKQCARPTNTAVTKTTYYTWVGDAKKGLQLQSVTLVQSSIGEGPCTNLGVGTTTSDPSCNESLETLRAGLCSAADVATNPDCTQYYDQNLNVYYRLKSKTVSVTEDCHPYRNTVDQTDAQYASKKDSIYYLSRSENRTCPAAAASCRAYSGTTGAASRKILSDTFEGREAANWTGGVISSASTVVGGHSLLIQLNGSNGVAFSSIASLKNALQKGKTYILKFTAASAEGSTTPRIRAFFGTGNDTDGTFNANGAAFQSSTDLGVSTRWNTEITPQGPEWQQYSIGPVTLTDDPAVDWRLGVSITGGNVYIDNLSLIETRDTQYLINNSAPQCPATDIGCSAYKDRDNNTVTVTSFNRLCNQQVVGCAAVIDTKNSATPFEQTVKGVTTPADSITQVVNDRGVYCKASAKGCSMYGQPQYIQDSTLKSLKTVYLINNPDRYEADLCLANENSCRLFTQTDGGTVVLKDPGTSTCSYVQNKSGGGAWYITGTTIPCATRAPENLQPVGASCSPVCSGGSRSGKACGIPTSDVNINAVQCPSGGTCVGDLTTAGRIISGNGTVPGTCSENTQCAGNNGCVYQVGVCPQQQNSCTLFRDPANPPSCQSNCSLKLQGGSPIYVDASCVKTVCRSQTGTPGAYEGQNCQNSTQCGAGSICAGSSATTPTTGAPGCAAYTYLKNTLTDDAGTCDGIVDPKQGCLPFNDTSLGGLNFRGQ